MPAAERLDVAPPHPWSPEASVRRLCRLVGEDEVVSWCAGLLSGAIDERDPDRPSLVWLGGGPASDRLAQADDDEPTWKDYWVRTWAARGLLHNFSGEAVASVVDALHDPHWRVREMTAKVCARHEVAEAAEQLAGLLNDENARVRAAAARALGATAESDQLPTLADARDDPDNKVAAAADRALSAALERLDLPVSLHRRE